MILVSDIIDHLTSGEFTQLSIAKDLTNVTKEEEAIKKVLRYIDLAVIELHKRFDLKTIQGTSITGVADTYTYDLAWNTSDRLIRLYSIYNDAGLQYRINDESDANSVFTPVYNKVYVPNIETGDILYPVLSVVAPAIGWNTDKATTTSQLVPVPISMLEALLHYIGYRGHGSLDGAINTENNTHLMRFEASCQRLKELGLGMEYNLVSANFSNRGFI